MTDITISTGFSDPERPAVAEMYWQAFGAKLGKVLGPADRALAFFTGSLNPDFALTARDSVGRILGVAGFKTRDGGLIDGGFRDLSACYGFFPALWRAALVGLLERRVEPGILLMDGIFVTAEARGRGVGTLLLQAIRDEALRRGMSQVRLDVVDNNPRARALYERFGFTARDQEHLGPFRHIFGFSSATRMVLPLAPAAQ